ncbi:hypothetical protein, partial [Weissella cibaria]|uniref:hypothetical protein n=1 Tax=Weissella cibaria TaxID=137591 RepID=UPI0005C5AEAA
NYFENLYRKETDKYHSNIVHKTPYFGYICAIYARELLASDQRVTKVTTIKSPPDKEVNPSPAG